ncbi:MAG: hypothetical protein JW881_14635 [Spirochaetales bacterium]|nr:hypothetical protein [Spirochaetales bacterium]
MENELIKTASGKNPEEVINKIKDDRTGFILFFYGADIDTESLYNTLKKTDVLFAGCMDSGRLYDNSYLLDTTSVTAMSFSKKLFSSSAFGLIDMSPEISPDEVRSASKKTFIRAAQEASISLDNPDMERDFAINLCYGLNSATPFLEGQSEAGMMLQTVGGSSGGKTDFVTTNVMSHLGRGKIGVVALFKLADEYAFKAGRVSSFDILQGKKLTVTKLDGPRHIVEFDGRPASEAYAQAVRLEGKDLTPDTFANYTLGIEPGDGERLITSIMTTDESGKGLLTYNDVIEQTVFYLFKAIDQRRDRSSILKGLSSQKLLAYISFDCILCYLARNTLDQVDAIAGMYGEYLPGIPKTGFGTFSENICGANINQTETYLAIYRKK